MVAGGGPAGMEFALTAAEAGHDVTLYEKEDSLGGQVNLAKASPGKADLGRITDSMRGRMNRYGVKVELGSALTAETIEKEKPDVLAVASGARPVDISVPGVDKPHVHCAWDVLMERVPDIGKNVVIVGGNATGCETAHFLTAMGTPDPAIFTFLMYHTAENPESAKKLLHNSGRKITVVEMVNSPGGQRGPLGPLAPDEEPEDDGRGPQARFEAPGDQGRLGPRGDRGRRGIHPGRYGDHGRGVPLGQRTGPGRDDGRGEGHHPRRRKRAEKAHRGDPRRASKKP